MFSVNFSDTFSQQIRQFTRGFNFKNIELIIDSGLDVESVIISNYVTFAKSLRTTISREVKKYFSQEIIAKNISGENIYSVLQIHTFRVFVYFSEDKESKTRYLESIEFFRK